MHIVNAETMQKLDQRTIKELGIPGAVLMERAALGILACLLQHYGDQLQRVEIVVGPGNNGGDGLVLARLLHCRGLRPRLWLQGSPERRSSDFRSQYEINRKLGLEMRLLPDHNFAGALQDASLVVDALLGVGLSRDVEGSWAEVIAAFENLKAPVVSVDLPSGLDANTGAVLGRAVRADLTVSCALPKWAHLLDCALDYVGQLDVADIGIPPTFYAQHREKILHADWMGTWLPQRRSRDSHKGSYGKLGIVAGAMGMSGAARMAAEAALQSGVGLVFLYVPDVVQEQLAVALPEVQVVPLASHGGQLSPACLKTLAGHLGELDTVLIGPGLGRGEGVQELIQTLLRELQRPLVLDADALYHLAEAPQRFEQPVILTPHPGELGRLIQTPTTAVQAHRVQAVRQCVEQYGATTILKGARSLIATPSACLYFNSTGNPGMARGGMGDVLAGLCAGLFAQGLKPEQAAGLATFWHGLAGDQAAQQVPQRSLTVQRLLAALPQAWQSLLKLS